jgi:hypothetical protein
MLQVQQRTEKNRPRGLFEMYCRSLSEELRHLSIMYCQNHQHEEAIATDRQQLYILHHLPIRSPKLVSSVVRAYESLTQNLMMIGRNEEAQECSEELWAFNASLSKERRSTS